MHVIAKTARPGNRNKPPGSALRRLGGLRLTGALIVSLGFALTTGPRMPEHAAAAPLGARTSVPRIHAQQTSFYLEKNVGQAPREVQYIAHAGSQIIDLDAQGTIIARTGRSLLRLKPQNGAAHPRLVTADRRPGIFNYFIGKYPKHWYTDIPTFGRVTYRDVYPGIDLTFHGQGEQLEYDWVVKPGADPGRIQLATQGAALPVMAAQGAVRFGALPVLQTRPLVYQRLTGSTHLVQGGYRLPGHETIRFQVGHYDHSRPLVIDPVMKFAEFLGGFGDDEPARDWVDAKGNIYIAGKTTSPDLPTENAFQAAQPGQADMFVIKLNPGGGLVYSTYIGGSGNDSASSIAVDRSGQATVVGYAQSSNFPLIPQTTFPGGQVAVILSLGAGGDTLRYSVAVSSGDGDRNMDAAQAVTVDAQGTAYVVLFLDIPEKEPREMAMVKIDPNGPNGPGTTFRDLGGRWIGTPTGIAVLPNGNVVVVGNTDAAGFFTSNAFQQNYGGNTDGFVTEVDPSLRIPVFSTFLGGANLDSVNAVAVDGSNNIYVTGTTLSPDFPQHTTLNVAGAFDPFVTKFSGSGHIIYNSVVAMSTASGATAIVVNKQGYATIGGETAGSSFRALRPLKGQGGFHGGAFDGFVMTLGGAGKKVLFSTYLGGKNDDVVTGLALGGAGNVFVTGYTGSADFPRTRGDSFNSSGKHDGFLMKIGNH